MSTDCYSKSTLKTKIIILLAVFFLLSMDLFYSESFRVHGLHTLVLAEDYSSCYAGVNDSVAIKLNACDSFNQIKDFVQGIEVKVEIPKSISEWRDSVACSVYDSVVPFPSEEVIDYSGNRIFLKPLPSKLSWILQIPLSEENSIKEDSYTTSLSIIPDLKNDYVFVRFLPVMKGVPEEAFESKLKVSARPVLMNKGKLSVCILPNDTDINNSEKAESLRLFVDEKPLDTRFAKCEAGYKVDLLLSPGVHNISVQSDDFRNEVRSIVVEQAKKTTCDIQLRSLVPLLKITAPDNAEVFIDDKKVLTIQNEIEVLEGERKISFQIGGYEIIRSLTVQKGKTYNINLSIDLQISEE